MYPVPRTSGHLADRRALGMSSVSARGGGMGEAYLGVSAASRRAGALRLQVVADEANGQPDLHSLATGADSVGRHVESPHSDSTCKGRPDDRGLLARSLLYRAQQGQRCAGRLIEFESPGAAESRVRLVAAQQLGIALGDPARLVGTVQSHRLDRVSEGSREVAAQQPEVAQQDLLGQAC